MGDRRFRLRRSLRRNAMLPLLSSYSQFIRHSTTHNPGIPDARLSFRTPYHILHVHLPAPEQPHNNRSSYESLETAEGPSVDLYHLSFENSGAATELPA